jgi:hypothetical protein
MDLLLVQLVDDDTAEQSQRATRVSIGSGLRLISNCDDGRILGTEGGVVAAKSVQKEKPTPPDRSSKN